MFVVFCIESSLPIVAIFIVFNVSNHQVNIHAQADCLRVFRVLSDSHTNFEKLFLHKKFNFCISICDAHDIIEQFNCEGCCRRVRISSLLKQNYCGGCCLFGVRERDKRPQQNRRTKYRWCLCAP